MIERAVKDAREKAAIMAQAAECQLGSVVNIRYNQREIHVYSEARNIHSNKEAMACSPSSLDVSPDDFVMGEDVDVTWELKNLFETNNNEKG